MHTFLLQCLIEYIKCVYPVYNYIYIERLIFFRYVLILKMAIQNPHNLQKEKEPNPVQSAINFHSFIEPRARDLEEFDCFCFGFLKSFHSLILLCVCLHCLFFTDSFKLVFFGWVLFSVLISKSSFIDRTAHWRKKETKVHTNENEIEKQQPTNQPNNQINGLTDKFVHIPVCASKYCV